MPSKSGTVLIGQSFSEDKLFLLAQKSKQMVFETKSIFPFELFPDKLVICLNRINITYSKLWFRDERPIPFEYINTAHISRGLFFASLSIETFGVEKPPAINHLPIDEARVARRYILALVECKKNGIDFSGYSLGEIKDQLQTIGKVRE